MSRRAVFIVFVLLSLLLSGGSFQEAPRQVRVGVYENPPKVYTNSDGVIDGFWPVILNDIAIRENWELVWIKCSWEECLDRLEKNQIDLMVDVGVNDERKEKFVFSDETVLVSWTRVYVREGSEIQTILDLDNKKVAGLEGSVNFDGPDGIKALAEEFGISVEFRGMSSYEAVFQAVQNGIVDAGVTNKDYGDLNEKEYGLNRTPIIIQPTQLTFAYPIDGQLTEYLMKTIDRNIVSMKADQESVYYSALDNYFGLRSDELIVETIPSWVPRLALWTLGVLLFLLAVSVTSRIQVNRQTKKLHESETRYETLTRVTPVGIFRTDVEGKTTFVNETWCHIAGLPFTDAIGIGWLKAIHPEDREMLAKNWETITALSKGSTADYRFLHADGSVVWVIGQAVPEYNAKSELIGYVGTITDITERKKVEELKVAVAKAESADKLKSAFLATMSHELRTPLNSIIGFTGILLQKLVGPLSLEQEKQLKMVQSSALHLLNLINDVLDISKIEADQVTIANEEFEITQVYSQCLEKIQPMALTKGLKLTKIIEHDPVVLKSDKRRVEQILINLLNNAVKFTESGEVVLMSKLDGETIQVSIKDSGIGIAKEDVQTLFMPFKQIDTGLTRKYEGTGLGLSICKRLVELLGGKIWVESELDKGSEFIFTLPLQRSENE
jgi:PAS domain S-box-containing protein